MKSHSISEEDLAKDNYSLSRMNKEAISGESSLLRRQDIGISDEVLSVEQFKKSVYDKK